MEYALPTDLKPIEKSEFFAFYSLLESHLFPAWDYQRLNKPFEKDSKWFSRDYAWPLDKIVKSIETQAILQEWKDRFDKELEYEWVSFISFFYCKKMFFLRVNSLMNEPSWL